MSLERLRGRRGAQHVLGLLFGVVFGFLLQKGGVTDYDVIIGQLLLTDMTVVRVMLSAVVVGSIGVHLLGSAGLARLQPKPQSARTTALGGLLFGFGFALLGYCPGTVAGAVGSGALDALLGGVTGILLGAGLYAAAYSRFRRRRLVVDMPEGRRTLPELLGVSPWAVVLPGCALLVLVLWLIRETGV